MMPSISACLLRPPLHPIRAADDDLQVVRRLRSWFARDRFTDLLADLALALVCTSEPKPASEHAERILPMLGPGWVVAGQPLTTRDVTTDIHRLNSTMRGLDLIENDRSIITPGPSACWLLPRATRLARLWRTEDQASEIKLTRT